MSIKVNDIIYDVFKALTGEWEKDKEQMLFDSLNDALGDEAMADILTAFVGFAADKKILSIQLLWMGNDGRDRIDTTTEPDLETVWDGEGLMSHVSGESDTPISQFTVVIGHPVDDVDQTPVDEVTTFLRRIDTYEH